MLDLLPTLVDLNAKRPVTYRINDEETHLVVHFPITQEDIDVLHQAEAMFAPAR